MPNRSTPPQNLTAAPAAPRWHADPASDKQVFYIETLAAGREMAAEHRDWLTDKLTAGINKGFASRIIEALKALPPKTVKVGAVRDLTSPAVPAGHYALEHPADALNPIRFYVVQDGKGRWEGKQFLKRYSSDETFDIKGVERYRVLTAIAADTMAAAQLYGRETGNCCRCNRKLTRETSRALGYGPECAQYMEA